MFIVVDSRDDKPEHSVPKETHYEKMSDAVGYCEDQGFSRIRNVAGNNVEMVNEDESQSLKILIK